MITPILVQDGYDYSDIGSDGYDYSDIGSGRI